MSGALRSGGTDLQWGTRTTWYDQQYWVWGPQLAHLEAQEMNRNASAAGGVGMSYDKAPPAAEYDDQQTEFAARFDAHSGQGARATRRAARMSATLRRE